MDQTRITKLELSHKRHTFLNIFHRTYTHNCFNNTFHKELPANYQYYQNKFTKRINCLFSEANKFPDDNKYSGENQLPEISILRIAQSPGSFNIITVQPPGISPQITSPIPSDNSFLSREFSLDEKSIFRLNQPRK